MNEIKQTLQQDADALLKRLQQSRKNGTGVTLSVSDVGVLCEVLGGGGWISVKDQLPKNGQSIHVYLSYGKQATCVFFEDGNNFVDSLRFQHSNGGVTHWMPLPKEPSHD